MWYTGDLDHFLEIQIVSFLWRRLKTELLIGVWRPFLIL